MAFFGIFRNKMIIIIISYNKIKIKIKIKIKMSDGINIDEFRENVKDIIESNLYEISNYWCLPISMKKNENEKKIFFCQSFTGVETSHPAATINIIKPINNILDFLTLTQF